MPETLSLQLEINPAEIDAEYLRCLHACFPNWGDEQVSHWAFHRVLPPDPPPDRFILRENGEPLAGSAVSYRSVRLVNGNIIRAGIMTGSWTLPAARGRGCFARMIEESAAITRDRGGALLLAFVTEDNPSRRQLEKAGAALFPTSYLIADAQPPSAQDNHALSPLKEFPPELFQHWTRQREGKGKCHFAYASFEGWKGQFIDRPLKPECVQIAPGSFAVLEKHLSTTRINAFATTPSHDEQFLLHALQAQAAVEGRKLFTLSTDPAFSAVCKQNGFAEKPGFLTAIVTHWTMLGKALGVPSEPSTAKNGWLTEPSSPWFLGPWDLQTGDRM